MTKVSGLFAVALIVIGFGSTAANAGVFRDFAKETLKAGVQRKVDYVGNGGVLGKYNPAYKNCVNGGMNALVPEYRKGMQGKMETYCHNKHGSVYPR